ncbi:transcriptional regulator, TetR family [Geodermatophilus telluris]|uniref:Transcriptional regulator, TetR family n=1 Tax=Geodermatophilus telluris TaxID=1190417 RepID=A0A1G6RNZ8_9ACTN|nr:TetR-like C-terminal domain-containing protein [Geodermatophilus telluris]SDD06410.1 transcriptional regulator, TetR family [Geodermatophilus telluris]
MPRAGLSRDAVVAEALRVADEVGLDRLTLAAVAQRCGVRLPSLYKHVAGLPALHAHAAAAAERELAAELSAATVGRAGEDALLALAEAYRGYARRRPGAYAATLRAPAGEGDTSAGAADHRAAAHEVMGVVLSALAGFGLSGEDAVDAVRGLRSLLHGFAALEAAGGFALPQDLDRSYRRLVRSHGEVLRSWSSAPGPAPDPVR